MRTKYSLSMKCYLLLLIQIFGFCIIISTSNAASNGQKYVYIAMKAISKGNIHEIKYLLSHGLNPNYKDSYNTSLLMFAAGAGNLDIVKLLVEKGADVNFSGSSNLTPLTMVSYSPNPNPDIVTYLIKHGAKINPIDSGWKTPLQEAIIQRKANIAKVLILLGANLNIPDGMGNTPLINAVMQLPKVVPLLVEKGAKINSLNPQGMSVLLGACYEHNSSLIRLLIHKGAKINQTNKYHVSPLSELVVSGSGPDTSFMIKHGAIVNMYDQNGDTPLIMSIQGKNISSCTILLKHGVDINHLDRKGKSALIYLFSKDHDQRDINGQSELNRRHILLKLLIEYGAKINQSDSDGRTPIMLAINYNDLNSVRILLEDGVDIEQKDRYGYNAFHYAQLRHNKRILNLLKSYNNRIQK